MPSSPLQTRGPLPARVYWTRRLVLLGVALVLVAGLARILGGASDGSDAGADKATTAGATTTSTTTPEASTEPVRRKRKKNRTPTEPPLAEPSGPCVSSDIVATPVIDTAAGATDVPITLNLRTLRTAACTWRVAPDTLTVSITSGDDFIWSSRECPTSIAVQDVVVRSAVDTPVVVTWDDARRSDEDCSELADWARPGYYHVEAAALGGEPADVQFELVPPPRAVITKTVTPKPEPTSKGKADKQGDTEHTPGEQGEGNSEG
ncbi:MAG: hypothetical protein JWN68_3652 [Nocardioides sp.]|jgi:hypothetical protein|uniref:hypothetical protein n=1 Tax=Nocardioides sp. TaxID=35761 RepID=UPI00262AF7FA|nr:hypothetical protein [Nocardioides sp.]MCW2835699.1 hypothetical protein [Nocardioides sp.]